MGSLHEFLGVDVLIVYKPCDTIGWDTLTSLLCHAELLSVLS